MRDALIMLAIWLLGLAGLATLALMVRRPEEPARRPARTHTQLMVCPEVRRTEDTEECEPYKGDWYLAPSEADGGEP